MGRELDKAKEVRKGEQLNEKALESFMIKALGVEQGKLSVQQFPSGFSNLTYLIEFAHEEYVLRRPPLVRTSNRGMTWEENIKFFLP